MQRETFQISVRQYNRRISILSLYAEGDQVCSAYPLYWFLFQSSPSMQRETSPSTITTPWYFVFQSSPSMQRETRREAWAQLRRHYFNPLPLCRGRRNIDNDLRISAVISILSLYAEGDQFYLMIISHACNFNPLPLCRGRPCRIQHNGCSCRYFNPLPLCRGRRGGSVIGAFGFLFQSSPSMQRETLTTRRTIKAAIRISILSLYAEGDHL